MKEAKTIWLEICQTLIPDSDIQIRLLTDLTGPAYSLVLETELKDFVHLELQKEKWKSSARIAELYQQFIPLCESSERVLYNLEFQN